MLGSESCAATLSTFHFHFFYRVFYFYLLDYFPSPAACCARLLHPALIPSTLAMLANFPSSETVNLLSSCIKFLERDPHFCPEVSTFPQGCLLKFLESGLSVEVVCDPLGDVNKCLVCSFDFYVFLLDFWVAGVAIGVVLD